MSQDAEDPDEHSREPVGRALVDAFSGSQLPELSLARWAQQQSEQRARLVESLAAAVRPSPLMLDSINRSLAPAMETLAKFAQSQQGQHEQLAGSAAPLGRLRSASPNLRFVEPPALAAARSTNTKLDEVADVLRSMADATLGLLDLERERERRQEQHERRRQLDRRSAAAATLLATLLPVFLAATKAITWPQATGLAVGIVLMLGLTRVRWGRLRARRRTERPELRGREA